MATFRSSWRPGSRGRCGICSVSLLALAILLGACGGDTDESSTTAETTAATTTETTELLTTTAAPSTPVPAGEMVLLYDLGNSAGIHPGPPAADSFVSLDTPVLLTRIRTYHWNGSDGAPPGTVSLVGPRGDTYGPWQAYGCGQSVGFDDPCGVDGDLYWLVDLELHLAQGTYQVVDSDPATWASNPDSGNAGHVLVWGYVFDDPPERDD
ncbi:MAG: hypothetical protein GY925_11210 [Actinomycetia bacterium]|nr:hypothetical protein [Actinomycetes bacterium]